jgi:hypothetical protein
MTLEQLGGFELRESPPWHMPLNAYQSDIRIWREANVQNGSITVHFLGGATRFTASAGL